ncbi:MAG: hypothetical protein AAGI09_00435 [Pseudomonadota bacterium]
MNPAPLLGFCAVLALAACDNSELGRSLGVPQTMPIDQVAESLPDYAIESYANQALARFMAENCSTLSFNAPVDVSGQFKLYDRLEQDGFPEDLLENLPAQVEKALDERIYGRILLKLTEMNMSADAQSCSKGRRQIEQGTDLGALLIDDRGAS